jgi:hypothetical protein
VSLVFTTRNIGGVALFLFGTTFLWMTPTFASKGVSTKGTWWAATNAICLMTVVAFTAATWGLFTKANWWEGVAIASALLGVLVLAPYWIAARDSGETTPGFNVLIHALGDGGVLLLLLVPSLETWVNNHVMAGR